MYCPAYGAVAMLYFICKCNSYRCKEFPIIETSISINLRQQLPLEPLFVFVTFRRHCLAVFFCSVLFLQFILFSCWFFFSSAPSSSCCCCCWPQPSTSLSSNMCVVLDQPNRHVVLTNHTLIPAQIAWVNRTAIIISTNCPCRLACPSRSSPPEWWWVVAIRAPNGHLRTLRVQTEPVCGAWECELVQPFSTGRYGLALTWPCLEAHTCAGIVQNSRVLVVIKGD